MAVFPSLILRVFVFLPKEEGPGSAILRLAERCHLFQRSVAANGKRRQIEAWRLESEEHWIGIFTVQGGKSDNCCIGYTQLPSVKDVDRSDPAMRREPCGRVSGLPFQGETIMWPANAGLPVTRICQSHTGWAETKASLKTGYFKILSLTLRQTCLI